MTAPLVFTAYGRPITQGSMRSLGRAPMQHSNRGTLIPWRSAVATEALLSAQDIGWARTDGPVTVRARFTFDRPASAPKRRRTWPTTRSSGDIDKLARALLDGIGDSGRVWKDDAQVTALVVSKAWAGDIGPR